MSKSIYDQFNAHTPLVAAHAILLNGIMVAKIVFKFPKDGAGRLYAYAHWFGVPMVRGSASGYGYDKKSAALSRLPTMEPDHTQGDGYRIPCQNPNQVKFIEALSKDDGYGWDHHLKAAGFTVYTVI